MPYEEIGHSLFYLPPEQKKDDTQEKQSGRDQHELSMLPPCLWLHIIYDDMVIPQTVQEKSESAQKQLITESDK